MPPLSSLARTLGRARPGLELLDFVRVGVFGRSRRYEGKAFFIPGESIEIILSAPVIISQMLGVPPGAGVVDGLLRFGEGFFPIGVGYLGIACNPDHGIDQLVAKLIGSRAADDVGFDGGHGVDGAVDRLRGDGVIEGGDQRGATVVGPGRRNGRGRGGDDRGDQERNSFGRYEHGALPFAILKILRAVWPPSTGRCDRSASRPSWRRADRDHIAIPGNCERMRVVEFRRRWNAGAWRAKPTVKTRPRGRERRTRGAAS